MKSLVLALTAVAFLGVETEAMAAPSTGGVYIVNKPSVGETLHEMSKTFTGMTTVDNNGVSTNSGGAFTNAVPLEILHYCNPRSPTDAYGNVGCRVPDASDVKNKSFAVCPAGSVLLTSTGSYGAIPSNNIGGTSTRTGYIWFTCSERIPASSAYYSALKSQPWTTCANPVGDNPVFQCSIVHTRPPVVNFVIEFRPVNSWLDGSGVPKGKESNADHEWLRFAESQVNVTRAGGNYTDYWSRTSWFDAGDPLGYTALHNAQAAWVYDESITPVLLTGSGVGVRLFLGGGSWNYFASVWNYWGSWGPYWCSGDGWGRYAFTVTPDMLGKTCKFQCGTQYFGYAGDGWGGDHWLIQDVNGNYGQNIKELGCSDMVGGGW